MEYFTYFIIYLSMCWVLFKYPQVLHNKVKDLYRVSAKFPIWIVAHRGGGGEFPENTLEAFKNAFQSDMLELDVVLSRDQILIVSHDNDLFRLTSQKKSISSMNYSDLPSYSKSFISHFLPHPFHCKNTANFTSLEEVFKAAPDQYICVDVKSSTDFAISEVKKLIEKYKRAHITVITI